MEIGGSRIALEIAQAKGYVSYSSLVRIRDGVTEVFQGNAATEEGFELHSRFLEKKKTARVFDAEVEKRLTNMESALNADALVSAIMRVSMVELPFDQILDDVRVFGRLDILSNDFVADLKTTSCTTMNAFVASLDFLQAALYLRVTDRKDFYYVGVSKINLQVFVFRVAKYPGRMKEANKELDELLKYVKANTKQKQHGKEKSSHYGKESASKGKRKVKAIIIKRKRSTKAARKNPRANRNKK